MALEPPDGYVAFVARHLEWLRDEAVRAAGDERDGDALYPEVLSDVARRWGWLEWRRRMLGQHAAAEEYLHRALARRIRRSESEQLWGREDDTWTGEIEVWRADPPGASLAFAGYPDAYGRPHPAWSSSAVRLAPYVRPGTRVDVGPVAEAAIAWWHAYEARRRRRHVAVLVAILAVVAVLMRFQTASDAALGALALGRASVDR